MSSETSDLCICGHGESMHYAISGACLKVITRDYRLENHLQCTCKKYRSESPETSEQIAKREDGR